MEETKKRLVGEVDVEWESIYRDLEIKVSRLRTVIQLENKMKKKRVKSNTKANTDQNMALEELERHFDQRERSSAEAS